MRKLEMLTDGEKKAHEGKTGDYNKFPPGWRQITEKDACNSMFFRYFPVLVEYRQMLLTDGSRGYVAAYLYHYHDGTGIGVAEDRRNDKIEWYAFGCAHSYRTLSPEECSARTPKIYHWGRFCHVYECSKCGHVESVDSSG